MSNALTIRQQIAPRPGAVYSTEPRSLSFTQGALFSFRLHATSYDSDAATIRIPSGLKLCLQSASVDGKQMTEFIKRSCTYGASLKFSSEENGEMLVVWNYDKERTSNFFQTGLGIEVEGPRTVRLAGIIDQGFKMGSGLDINVFGSVRKGVL